MHYTTAGLVSSGRAHFSSDLLWLARVGGRPYHGLHDVPLLSGSLGQGLPDLLTQAHVFLGHLLELSLVPVIGALALHQPLVSLATGVGRLVGEIVALDLSPIKPLLARLEQVLVILGCPGARGGTMRHGRLSHDGSRVRVVRLGLHGRLRGCRGGYRGIIPSVQGHLLPGIVDGHWRGRGDGHGHGVGIPIVVRA